MIPRIPSARLQYEPFKDNDIKNAYNWIRSFMSDKEWLERKEKIEKDISIPFLNHPSFVDIRTGTLIAIQKDQIGWYLYLIYTLINEPYRYDYFQGARIVPIFKRIGMNLELVKSIGGINKKIRDLLSKRTSEADAILFEVLTALLWVRNGWDVKVLEEGKGNKTPDFQMTKDGEIWQVISDFQNSYISLYWFYSLCILFQVRSLQFLIQQVNSVLPLVCHSLVLPNYKFRGFFLHFQQYCLCFHRHIQCSFRQQQSTVSDY